MIRENKQGNSNEEDEDISLKNLIFKIRYSWGYVLSKWMTILCCAVIGAILGFTYSYFKKPTYTATTSFVLEDEKSGSGLSGLAGLASIAGVDVGSGGGLFQGDNILGLYRSRTMLQKTLLTYVNINGEPMLLVNRYIDFLKLRKMWVDKPILSNLRFELDSSRNQNSKPDRLRDSVLGSIVKDINDNFLSVTKPDKKLSTIQVDVKSKDEFFAKAFNDELVKNVNEFYIATKTQKTLMNVKILQRKTDSVRAVMNGEIYRAVAVSDATPNLNPTRQIQRVAPEQKANFSAETNKAVLAEMLKNLEMSKLSLLKETPLIQIIDKPIFPLYKENLSILKGTFFGSIFFGLVSVVVVYINKVIKDNMI